MLDILDISNHALISNNNENKNSIQKSKKNLKKILLIATYDSFLRSGLAIAKIIDNAQIEIKIRTSVTNQLSTKQLKNILKEEDLPCSSFFLNNYKDIDYNQYDIIIISAGNTFNESFFQFYLSSKIIKHKNILTITLFPGVIFGDINSIVSRIHGDILLCNNKMDYDIANKIKKNWSLSTEVMHYGFPVIEKINMQKEKNIYFFEQVKIPENYLDRMYLLTKLIELAFDNPNEKIYIKPRVSLSEKTIHPNQYPMERLIKKYKKKNPIPSNLFFTYEDITLCLSKTKLAITLSSTVAFETIYNDIPTIIISDFGLKNNFANHYFMDSGCMFNFKDLNKVIPKIDKDWYMEMIDFPKEREYILNTYIAQYSKIDRDTSIPNCICTQTHDYLQYLEENSNKTIKEKIIKIFKKPKLLLNIMYSFILHNFSNTYKDFK